jgi:hypothetical protein
MPAGGLDVVVSFIADASSIQQASAQVQGTGSKLKSWAKGVGAAIGIAFAADQLRDWMKAASDVNESMNKVTTVFGKSATSVQRFAKDAATNLGLSRQEALDAAGAYGNMFTQLGFVSKEAATMSKGMLTLTADIASFHNVDPTQVLEAQAAAFRGEYDALQRFVPTISAATVETKALAMTGKESADQLTAQEKAAATYQLMIEGAGKATGDFARTSDSAANQQRIMNAQWKDAQAALGQALLPALQVIVPLIATMATFIKDNAGWLVPLTAAIIGVVAAIKLWIAVQTVIDALLAANPVGAIVLAVVALIAVITVLVLKWDEIWAWIGNLPWYAKVGLLILAIINPIVQVIAIVRLFQTQWDGIWSGIENVIAAAGNFIGSVVDNIVGFFRPVAGAIAGALSAVTSIITAPFIAAWSFVRQVPGWIGDAFQAIPSMIAGALAAVTNIITAPFQAAWDIVSGIARTIGDAIGTAKGAYNTFARAWNAIEVKTPSIDIGPVHIGGQTIGLPDLPILAKGGIVTGPTLALLGERGPEAVIPLSGANAGATFNINVAVAPGTNPAEVGREIVDKIRAYERVSGRSWRAS